VRRNVIGLLETQGKVPAELYEAIGWSADRFWHQFSARAKGPRLDFVEQAAGALGVPVWRLLARAGETEPKIGSTHKRTSDSGTIRHFIRLNAWQFLEACSIPTEARANESPINLRVRQNAAIGCWQCWITEVELYRDHLQIQRATWHAWFRRKTGVGLADLWRIAQTMGMKPWELVAEVRTYR
jgi:hypothetical protein